MYVLLFEGPVLFCLPCLDPFVLGFLRGPLSCLLCPCLTSARPLARLTYSALSGTSDERPSYCCCRTAATATATAFTTVCPAGAWQWQCQWSPLRLGRAPQSVSAQSGWGRWWQRAGDATRCCSTRPLTGGFNASPTWIDTENTR